MEVSGAFHKLKVILEMIKFEHTIFALPFALISVLLASTDIHLPHNLPSARTFGWVLIAMIGARSAAMTFNRIVDAKFDAQNPRTAVRAIPAGQVTREQATLFTVIASALLVLAAYELNPLCFVLSPVALFFALGYSYAKRFTFLCHLFLGFAIGIAPIGAWIAVEGKLRMLPMLLGLAVLCWIGGFDIIYALQDEVFDRENRLFSIPEHFGKSRALFISRTLHLLAVLLLVGVGVMGGLHFIYFIGVAVAGGLIFYEQSIVSPTDLSRVNLAFFTLNGWVSMSLLAFVLLDRLINQ